VSPEIGLSPIAFAFSILADVTNNTTTDVDVTNGDVTRDTDGDASEAHNDDVGADDDREEDAQTERRLDEIEIWMKSLRALVVRVRGVLVWTTSYHVAMIGQVG
jgi:hypothetical protein